jgi:hypothetical protein
MHPVYRFLALALTVTVVAARAPAPADGKNCDELKKEIADKLDAKGVKDYTLEIVATADVKEGAKVVGSCEGGTKKIVYSRK